METVRCRAGEAVFHFMKSKVEIDQLSDAVSRFIARVRRIQECARERVSLKRPRVALLFYYWENIVNTYNKVFSAAVAAGRKFSEKTVIEYHAIRQIPEY